MAAGFLHTYIIAIFRCGRSVSSLATSQEAKIARALATDCRHSMLSLQRTSFHLTPSFEKSLYGCVLIPTMLQRVCGECELEPAFFDVLWNTIPKVRSRPRRWFRRGKQEVPGNKSLKWTTPKTRCMSPRMCSINSKSVCGARANMTV